MKWITVPGAIVMLCCYGAAPAGGHDCCHHGHDGAYGECDHPSRDCDRQGSQATNRLSPGSARSGALVNLQTLEGRIAEVVYLPGAAADSGMVEIKVQSAGGATLVRLAPAGFLKRSGMLLQEGDTVTVKGFPVAGMEGDLVVAAEIRGRERQLTLRDARGLPVW